MTEQQPGKSTGFIAILPAVLACSLLVMLFPAPQPRMISSHTWRAELITTVFLFASFLTVYFRDRASLIRIFTLRERSVNAIVICFGAFLAWGVISAFWAVTPYATWHHTVVWIEYIFCFLLVREQLRSGHGFSLICDVFLWMATIIGVLCVIDYVTLPDFTVFEGQLRARYSSYSELLVAALPLIWAISVYTNTPKKRFVILTAGILGWTTVMLSLSKGAFTAGLIGFAIMFLGGVVFGLERFRRRLIVTAGIWLIVTVAVQIGFSFLTSVPATIDYISGKADATRETSVARVMIWKVGSQMVREHWLFGVGADNFGISFNPSREKYRIGHPDDPKEEIVSDNLAERAHNELLQTTAELGVVGLTLLVMPVVLFLALFIRALRLSRFALSPTLWAAVGGMAAFGASSMVSSFSLRIVQNGIVFFIVFAVAINEIVKATGDCHPTSHLVPPRVKPTVISAAVTLIFVAMATTLSFKAAAEYLVYSADRNDDNEAAINAYHRAAAIDPEYKAAYLRSSGRSFSTGDYPTAATELKKAIDGGFGVVITYSALADCQTKTGDAHAAEQTFLTALRIYPRSVFLRMRYAVMLKNEGRDNDFQTQMEAARSTDSRQAAGWYNLLTNGSVSAFYTSRQDSTIAAPAELRPEAAVLQFLDKSPDSQDRDQ